jgi:NAD(P)-dependent dehydrogenase (short-subunit alcohol dehydrogenase family)
MAQRTALVTGGNRGIGFATCRALAQQGLRVVLAARHESEGRRAEAELRRDGLEVDYYPMDVAEPAWIDKMRRMMKIDGVAIDVLVNNAGVYTPGDAASVDEDDLEEAWAVNVRGPWLLTQVLLPGMRERGYGRIVNISSGSGSFAEGLDPEHAAYAATKAALNAFTVCLAKTLVNEDIKVNAMCPGWVRTRMGGSAAPRTPEEAADTAVWLATLPEHGPSGGFFRDRQMITR